MTVWRLAYFATAVIFPTICYGGQQTTYSYDAKGRLIRVVRAGTGPAPVNSTVRVDYTHDKASNRRTVSVTR